MKLDVDELVFCHKGDMLSRGTGSILWRDTRCTRCRAGLMPTLTNPILAKIGVSVFWPYKSKKNNKMKKKKTKHGRTNTRTVGPRRVGPRRVALQRVGGQNFALFFPLPPQFYFFLPSLGGLLVEFWWCFEAGRGPQMCTFGLSAVV